MCLVWFCILSFARTAKSQNVSGLWRTGAPELINWPPPILLLKDNDLLSKIEILKPDGGKLVNIQNYKFTLPFTYQKYYGEFDPTTDQFTFNSEFKNRVTGITQEYGETGTFHQNPITGEREIRFGDGNWTEERMVKVTGFLKDNQVKFIHKPIQQKFVYPNWFDPPQKQQRPSLSLTTSITLSKDDNNERYLLVDLTGSTISAAENGRLVKDTENYRGWFLDYAKVSLNIAKNDSPKNSLQRLQYSPKTQRLQGEISNEISYSLNLGSAGVGGGLGFSKSGSEMLEGFSLFSPDNGKDVVSLMFLAGCTDSGGDFVKLDDSGDFTKKPFERLKALLDGGGPFKGQSLNTLPLQAKSGLPIVTQGLWKAPQVKFMGTVEIIVDVEFQLISYGLEKVDSFVGEVEAFPKNMNAQKYIYTIGYQVPFDRLGY